MKGRLKIFFSLCIVFVAHKAQAQERDTCSPYVFPQEHHLFSAEETISFLDSVFSSGITLNRSSGCDCILIKYHGNGQVYKRNEYNDSCKLDGLQEEYQIIDSIPVLSYQSNYVNGQVHGSVYHYDSGRLSSLKSYEYGVKHGPFEFYDYYFEIYKKEEYYKEELISKTIYKSGNGVYLKVLYIWEENDSYYPSFSKIGVYYRLNGEYKFLREFTESELKLLKPDLSLNKRAIDALQED
ncbi:hypothetical protein GYB22_04835 [bacterium]|nr:hypothetical protein [bacterium]